MKCTFERISEAVKSSNLSYREISKLTGIPPSTLQRYASGQTSKIPIDKIESIAKATHVSAAYLMGWDDPPVPKTSIKKDYGVFKQNLLHYCKRMALAPEKVFDRAGIPLNDYMSWSQDNYPSEENVRKLSTVFHCPIEHLTEPQDFSIPENEGKNNFLVQNMDVHFIPVYESVSAGFGVSAIDSIQDYTPLFISNLHEAQNTICIRVRGDSMSPKIEDGDLIQVCKQDYVDSGSYAVVMVDDEEFFVKQIYYGETWIELHSINPFYKPYRFNGNDASRVKIVGIVRKIIKDV